MIRRRAMFLAPSKTMPSRGVMLTEVLVAGTGVWMLLGMETLAIDLQENGAVSVNDGAPPRAKLFVVEEDA